MAAKKKERHVMHLEELSQLLQSKIPIEGEADGLITEVCITLIGLKQTMDRAKEREGVLKDALMNTVREFGIDGVFIPWDSRGYTIGRVKGERRTIVAERLLELGVDPAIIEQATTVTPTDYLEIRETKGAVK